MSTALLWLVVIAAALILSAVLAVEETRVHEAQREAASWRARVCHHGATPFVPHDGDEHERGRSR